MLGLSQDTGQPVVIGRQDHFEYILKVAMFEIRGGSVQPGGQANGEVPVHRMEVWE